MSTAKGNNQLSPNKPQSVNRKSTPLNKTARPKYEFAFGRMNYLLTIAALALVVIGFVLMSGGTEDPFSTRKITVAPIVVLLGFGVGMYAIFYNPKSSEDSNSDNA